MSVIRWFIFALVAFLVGAGAALATDPPFTSNSVDVVSGLRDDVEAIQTYAANGQCDAVRGRLSGARSKVRDLSPEEASDRAITRLNEAIDQLGQSAQVACRQAEQAQQTPEPTVEFEATPEPTPEPVETPEPAPTEQPVSPDGGAPDPGTGEGEGAPQDAQPGSDGGAGDGGGVAIPQGAARLRDMVDGSLREMQKAEKRAKQRIEQHLGAGQR